MTDVSPGAQGLNPSEEIVFGCNAAPRGAGLCALLRVRNEQLILRDTLDYLAGMVDCIVAYDDASEDDTFRILIGHPAVGAVVRNHRWLPDIQDRLVSETRHRGLILHLARTLYRPRWFLCADADERIVGDVGSFISGAEAEGVDAVRIKLFDAYLTEADQAPYRDGPLLDFRQYFGPERRDIIMLWRATEQADYLGLDAREPSRVGTRIITRFYCQHYGKGLSVEHWEDTCRYYMSHFPWDSYGRKWASRQGKAVHTRSDFGRPLQRWGAELFDNPVTDF